jgi:hypothetical protein
MLYRHCLLPSLSEVLLGSRRKRGEMKQNGTHQLLVYADDADALVIASKATALELHASQQKHMLTSRPQQHAGQAHSINVVNYTGSSDVSSNQDASKR